MVRSKEIHFSEQLHRGGPGLYIAAVLLGTCHRANVGLREGMYGGIRRLTPLLSNTADRGDLRRVAMSERPNSGKHVWIFSYTWEIRSRDGFRKRTVVPRAETEYEGFGLKTADQRYINPCGPRTRTGADIEDGENGQIPETIETSIVNQDRIYPAGKRLIKSEATKARSHFTQDESAKSICWDFNSHLAFGVFPRRDVQECAYSHATGAPSLVCSS